MNILSLYDGMACGMIAMKRGGYQIDSYDAYEIDKYAIQSATHNFPEIVEHGDVFGTDFTEYKDIDFLMGGSPCTHWSIAQTKHRETEASGVGWELFSQYVKALREVKPKYFIYENNKSMSKAIRDSITETFGFDAICINSALVSAQNRQRLYWVGKRNENGTYSKVDVNQPEDRGILLKDILDGAMDLTSNDKSFCLTSSYSHGAAPWNTIERHQRNLAVEPVGQTKDCKSYCLTAGYSNGSGENIGNYAAHTLEKGCKSMVAEPVNTTPDGKSQTVKAQAQQTSISNIVKYKSTYGASGVAEMVDTSRQVGALPRPNGELSTSQVFRVYDTNAKSVTLKAGGGGAGGKTGLYAIPIEFENGVPTKAISSSDGKTYKVYSVSNGTIRIKDKDYPIKLQDGYYIIRKLSVNECKRLQQVPDWYEFPVSDSQAYKQLGNGWSIEIILHLIKSCLGDE
jgi:DNA (cytosine-5)-methyltransferase 3A